jgi:erythromycin esterase
MNTPRSILEDMQKLEKIAHPIRSVKADGDDKDLEFFRSVVVDATLVGLGEVTHGISEIFQMKHRLIEFLVKKMDFTIFSIEASMADAYRINDYVLHGIGDPRALLKGLNMFVWDNQDFFDLVEWMRAYNKTSSKKIQFTGFDSQAIELPSTIVKSFLDNDARIDKVMAALKKLEAKYFETEGFNFTQAELDAVTLLLSNEPEFIEAVGLTLELENAIHAKKEDPQYEWVLQNFKQIKFKLDGLITNPLIVRDLAMAANVAWIQKQNPGAKMILWAHNAHLQKNHYADFPVIGMGEHLARGLGDKYRVVGFAVHGGTYTAKDQTDNYKIKRDLVLATPPANTFEGRIKLYTDNNKDENSENPILFLDLHQPNQPQWLNDPVNARLRIGALREPDAQYCFHATRLPDFYDSMIYIANTHGALPVKAAGVELGLFGNKNIEPVSGVMLTPDNILKSGKSL